ncbi:MAG: hypothetical protein JWN83_534 [Chitinophagaceae bacterium]|nr:hypothetical protein [Chitinophagaceae bacterium]
MKQKFLSVLFAAAILLAGVLKIYAQDEPKWKAGDKIEVRNMSYVWVPATVLEVIDWRESGRGFGYRIQTDDVNAPNRYWTAPANTVRALPGKNNKQAQDENKNNDKEAGKNEGGDFKVGDQVDTYYDATRGHNRGTVIAVGNGRYKVHYTGCKATFDEWVDRDLVKNPNTISANAPGITFLFGKWSLTEVAIGNGNVFWGRSPGIQINADGTYTWYEDFGKQPVKGRWVTDAKVPGLDMGTPKFDGIIIKDAQGEEWKAFKWVVKNNNKPGIEIDKMCSNSSKVGSRL